MKNKPLSLRGFTLIELMVGLAISALTVAVGTQVVVSVNNNVAHATRTAQVDEEAKILTEYLGSQMQGVGGATLRPWGAVTVLNHIAEGTTSDELVITELDEDVILECGIADHSGNSHASSVELTNTRVAVDSTPSHDIVTCCFDGVDIEGREVIITDEDGKYWEQVLITGSNTASCHVNLTSSVANPDNFFLDPGPITRFNNGSVLLVKTRRFWLDIGDMADSSTHLLKMEQTVSDGTLTEVVLADRVRDFQVALGYDVDPRNGKVDIDGSSADEWLYNSPGDSLGGGGLAGGLKEDLRRIAIGIAVSTPTKARGGNSVQLLDGDTLTDPDEFYRGAVVYLTFRNSFIFK